MIKQQEINAAFCKGLKAFLLNYVDTKDLIEVISGYIDALNEIIGEILDNFKKIDKNDTVTVSVKCTCSDNNDFILITVHNSSESITLATIKRDNTGAFKEFMPIGSDEGIAVNNVEDIEKALLRMLEEPALISALYRLICQSDWPTFNTLDENKYEADLISAFKIKNFKATNKIDPEIKSALNNFFKEFCELNSEKKYQFSIKQSDASDVFSIGIQTQNNNELIKLKTYYGTYPVRLILYSSNFATSYSNYINNQDELIDILSFKIKNLDRLES